MTHVIHPVSKVFQPPANKYNMLQLPYQPRLHPMPSRDGLHHIHPAEHTT